MEALTFISFIFDGLLAILLILVAGFTLFSQGLFRAIVLYIAFGLLLALSWVRLDAPDIALAEIAIGAGLTGALLLSAWARLRHLIVKQEMNQHQGIYKKRKNLNLSAQQATHLKIK